MKIGYARVSTQDPNIDLQLDALKKYQCTLIYQEKKSGKNSERPELKKMLQSVREGDVLVIWKLDRLGRSLKDLVHLVGQLQEKKVDFVSLQDSINTSTPQGRLFFILERPLQNLKEKSSGNVLWQDWLVPEPGDESAAGLRAYRKKQIRRPLPPSVCTKQNGSPRRKSATNLLSPSPPSTGISK